MKQLILILGVVLLSGTETLAADMNLKDGARRTLETVSGSFPTEITSLNASRSNSPFALEKSSNSLKLGRQHLIEAGLEPINRPGAPGDRGGGRLTNPPR